MDFQFYVFNLCLGGS